VTGSAGTGIVKHPEYKTIDRTILNTHEHLVEHYGAHHIGVSKKRRRGRKLSETCITFYVLKKGRSVAPNLIPPYLDLDYCDGSRHGRIATDVCEIGTHPVALMIRGGHPVFGFDGEPGTVGLVFREGGRDLMLTNAHVVTDPGVTIPGLVTVRIPGAPVEVKGIVRRMDNLAEPVMFSDAALIEFPANTVESGKFKGTELRLTAYSDIAKNDQRQFFYIAREPLYTCRWLAWVPTETKINVDGRMKDYAGFHKFKVTKGKVVAGNSGAVVFAQSASGLVACGLLFGGHVDLNEIWVFPIRHCLKQMGFDS
jgi:hypothetical protein